MHLRFARQFGQTGAGSIGGLSAYGRKDQLSNRFLTDELGEIEISATYIPAIFLAVAVFLIYIVLSRLVVMQRTQIALLKAFGYSNFSVGMHYLKFALATVLAGLLPGLLFGLYLDSIDQFACGVRRSYP